RPVVWQTTFRMVGTAAMDATRFTSRLPSWDVSSMFSRAPCGSRPLCAASVWGSAARAARRTLLRARSPVAEFLEPPRHELEEHPGAGEPDEHREAVSRLLTRGARRETPDPAGPRG